MPPGPVEQSFKLEIYEYALPRFCSTFDKKFHSNTPLFSSEAFVYKFPYVPSSCDLRGGGGAQSDMAVDGQWGVVTL